jgi:prephenate dehydrogenase
MKTQSIAIIGLERVGASIGLALKKSELEVTLIGHDREHSVARQASELGAIDKVHRSLSAAASAADILVLAVPIFDLEHVLTVIGDSVREHTLILDLSGGKALGLRWAEAHLKRGHYVGASLALTAGSLADGRTGPDGARADLFEDTVLCLMPSPKATPKAVETAVSFGHVLGATPFFMDATEYDSLVQGLETVPGLLAAAMFRTVNKATGWRDMLRFAGLPFAQSTQPLTAGVDVAQMAIENKDATLRWLDVLLEELKQMRSWVADEEEEVLTAVLAELAGQREGWLIRRAENNWVEVSAPNFDRRSFTEQMFGGLARRRDRENDS